MGKKRIDELLIESKGEEIWDYKTLSSEEFSPLEPSEELNLALKAKNGDKKAKERIIKSNVRFVVARAKALSRSSGVPVEDLISEGILALYDAFENFDPNKKVRFLTYAYPFVESAMHKYIKSYKALTHMPTVSRKDLTKITLLYQKLGRAPTVEELSKELGYSKSKAKEIMEALEEKVFRLEGIEDEQRENTENFLSWASTSENTLEEEYENILLYETMAKLVNIILDSDILTEKEREVLWKVAFENKSLAAIAREMGYSREYIRQLKESAKKKIIKELPEVKKILP